MVQQRRVAQDRRLPQRLAPFLRRIRGAPPREYLFGSPVLPRARLLGFPAFLGGTRRRELQVRTRSDLRREARRAWESPPLPPPTETPCECRCGVDELPEGVCCWHQPAMGVSGSASTSVKVLSGRRICFL
jgi:hypothetical protein